MTSSFRDVIFCMLFLLSFTRAQIPSVAVRSMVDSVSTARLGAHIDSLQRAGGHWSRANFTPGLDSAVAYVLREMKKLPGLSTVALDTFYVPTAISPYNEKPMFNVVATLPGKKYPERIVVIGAHIDACGSRMPEWNSQWASLPVPGADDNASGVAAVLESARMMSDTAFGFVNDQTIVFVAFGVEETVPVYTGWTFGSLHFAQKAKERGENIVAAITPDMIGFNKDYLYLSIVSDNASLGIAGHLKKINEDFSLGITLSVAPLAYTWSDHASFWTHGFPAVCLIESAPPNAGHQYYTANANYHTSADTLGTLNLLLVQKATQLIIAAGATAGSAFTAVNREKENMPDGFALEQNYPNPFNPATTISFTAATRGRVSLQVFDILGRPAATVIDEECVPGRYSCRFDGSALPAGVYFYRLTTNYIVETRTMQLIK